MKNNKIGSALFNIMCELFGSFLTAIGIYNFAVMAKFPMTGFSGIAIILYRLLNIPIGLSTIALNIPVILICYKLLGKKFLISSLRCMVFSSLLVDYVAPLLPVYEGDRLLAALCTGVIAGAGYAIIYMRYSSTGGTDFIVMAVKAVRPYLSMGGLIFLTDAVIVIASGLIFWDIDGIIYGFIISFLYAVVVDKMLYGLNSGKLTLIVTAKGEEIAAVIDSSSGRGSTLLKAMGGYKLEEKQVVMCACSAKQMYFLQKAVKRADPEAFLIVLDSREVHGNGFKMIQMGEHSE